MAQQAQQAVERPHPGPRDYVKIAIYLAILTAAEIALAYVGLPDGLTIGLLLGFMLLKFALVVLWFMHLRFDSLLFRRLFVAGLAVAVAIYTIVLLIFGVLR